MFFLSLPGSSHAQVQRLKDFRSTPQTLALLGASTEFVEANIKDAVLQQMRRNLNRYTRSYGESSISGFKLGQNLNDQFFRPVVSVIGEPQKQYLKEASKENSIDIIALASIRDMGDAQNSEMEIQLFDARIETLSAIEKVQYTRRNQTQALEDLAYRVMNYIDKDGFVHPTAQDLLERPVGVGAANVSQNEGVLKEVAVNPNDLTGARLAGAPSIGGDKTPFWETWWFWTIIGSSLAVGGGMSYYFLVVDQDPNRGTVTFTLPQ